MNKQDRLSRMLGMRVEADAAPAQQVAGVAPMGAGRLIDIDRIVPDPDQPRRTFDEEDLERLAGSLRDHGQQMPILVRWDADCNRYVIVQGERRWRAAGRAGLRALMAVIDDGRLSSPDRILEVQVVENCLRSDLSPVEAGAAYKQLMALWGCDQKRLAERLHVSAAKVSRAIAALDLPAEVLEQVQSGKVGGTVAVMRERRRRKPGRPRSRPAKLSCPAGAATVTPRPGRTVVEVLAELLEQERRREAA